MRALPLISMAQEPQISSRQFESYETGVVFLPSRVTGFSAMSRRQMMTFMEGRHCRENSSQRAGSFGLAWRFTLTMTCFVSAMNPRQAKPQARWPEVQILFRGVVTARPRPDERNVDRLVGELDFVVHPLSARGLQPVGVVPAGKVRLVMSAARLVARQRAKRDHPRQDQHVLQLAGEVQRLVRPLRAVAEIDFLVALLQSADLCFGHLQVFVHACDGDVLGHDVSEFAPDRDGILRSVLTDELLILFFLALLFGIEDDGGNGLRPLLQVLGVLRRSRPGNSSAKYAGDQRVRPQPVGPVILVFAFPRGINARNIRCLIFAVHPNAADQA